jgi:esterase
MKLFFRKSGAGKPLIILHGLFGMSDNWMALSKQFAENGFTVYAADARNHGRSPHSSDFNYSVMSNDVVGLMNDKDISSAVLIGHSMGAKTAMWLACENPSRVSALVVADMSPRAYAPHQQSVIAAIHSVMPDRINSRKEAEARLRETLHDEATVQFLLKNLYWNEQEKLAWRFNLDGIEKNISSIDVALPSGYHFEGNTLFIRGERSGYITDADASFIRKQFPSAQIETVTGAGHWVHAENPQGFMTLVMQFLKSKSII